MQIYWNNTQKYEYFHSRYISHANLLEQKKCLHNKMVQIPHGLV